MFAGRLLYGACYLTLALAPTVDFAGIAACGTAAAVGQLFSAMRAMLLVDRAAHEPEESRGYLISVENTWHVGALDVGGGERERPAEQRVVVRVVVAAAAARASARAAVRAAEKQHADCARVAVVRSD